MFWLYEETRSKLTYLSFNGGLMTNIDYIHDKLLNSDFPNIVKNDEENNVSCPIWNILYIENKEFHLKWIKYNKENNEYQYYGKEWDRKK